MSSTAVLDCTRRKNVLYIMVALSRPGFPDVQHDESENDGVAVKYLQAAAELPCDFERSQTYEAFATFVIQEDNGNRTEKHHHTPLVGVQCTRPT